MASFLSAFAVFVQLVSLKAFYALSVVEVYLCTVFGNSLTFVSLVKVVSNVALSAHFSTSQTIVFGPVSVFVYITVLVAMIVLLWHTFVVVI